MKQFHINSNSYSIRPQMLSCHFGSRRKTQGNFVGIYFLNIIIFNGSHTISQICIRERLKKLSALLVALLLEVSTSMCTKLPAHFAIRNFFHLPMALHSCTGETKS